MLIPLIPEIIKAVPEVIGTVKKWITGSGIDNDEFSCRKVS